MEVLLTKSQKKGMMGLGSVTFTLHVQARLTDHEAELVKKYKLGNLVVYEKIDGITNAGGKNTFTSLALAVASRAFKLNFTVDNLVNGRTVEAKDISEVISARDEILNAAEAFHNLLMTSKYFEGEELIKFDDVV